MSANMQGATPKEGREECLEALYRIECEMRPIPYKELEANSDLSGIDVPTVLLDLVGRGDLELRDGTIVLKPSGRATGRRIYRRHELVERFFRLLGLKRETAHEEACRLEHITALPSERGAGRTGRDELSLVFDLLERGAMPLTQAHPGTRYRVGMVCGGRGSRRKLEEMGVSPGTEITAFDRRRGGPVEIAVRGSRLAIGRGIATKVLVVGAVADTAVKR